MLIGHIRVFFINYASIYVTNLQPFPSKKDLQESLKIKNIKITLYRN